MKNFIKALFLVLMISVLSCKKEERLESRLEGSWELRHILGGFRIADSPSDFPAGNGNIIKFEGANYERWAEGNMYSKGTFKIIKDQAEIDGTNYSYKLEFENKMDSDVHFKISDKEMKTTVGSQAHDGYTVTYEKL
jgi:hypothetical protein